MSDNKLSALKVWRGRVARQKAYLSQVTKDARSAASWHLAGNRRFFTRYAAEISSAHKWCFIVGCNNSGTSLLRAMLQRTGKISTFSSEGQRHTTTLVRANKRGHERVWTEYLDQLRLTDQDSVECFPRLLHDWMRELQLPIHEIIVEKTTVNAVRMTWLQKVFPRSCFIGVVRNGYAITEGIMRRGRKSAERGSRHWNLVNRYMLEDSKSVRNFLLLRYEDLVDNMDDSASRLAEFVGIDVDSLRSTMSEYYGYATVRGEGNLAVRNMNAEGIARLSSVDIATIRREARDMLDHFGYEP